MDADDLDVVRATWGEVYVHGECVTMALALHRDTGEPLVAATTSRGLVHAGTRVSGDRYRDVRGVVDEATFVEPFPGSPVLVDVDEETLRRLALEGGGKPIPDRLVETAARHACVLHPELPSAVAHAERVEAFGAELEDLCRRHGFFLREGNPNGMLLYRAYGDETGYGFRPLSHDTFVATRLLE